MPGVGSEPTISACPRYEAGMTSRGAEASKAFRTDCETL